MELEESSIGDILRFPDPTSEDERLFSGWLDSLSGGFSSITESIGVFVDSVSDQVVDNFAPDDADSSDSDASTEVLLEHRDVRLVDLSESLENTRERLGASLPDNEKTAGIMQNNIKNLKRRGQNLARLEDTLDESRSTASAIRQQAQELRAQSEAKSYDQTCCVLQ